MPQPSYFSKFSTTLLEAALTANGTGIWQWAAPTDVFVMSDALYRLLGYEPDAFPASVAAFRDKVHPDDAASFSIQQPQPASYRLIRSDGAVMYVKSVVTTTTNETGEVIYLGVIQDVTAERHADDQFNKMNERLERNNKELEQSNGELELFSYVASHDLQEPLRKIQTFSRMILERESEQLSDTGKDYFNRMVTAAQRMQKLLDDLLTFSRTNTMAKVFERVDLNHVLDQVRFAYRETILEQHATIEAQHLPEVNGIAFQLLQLFENLIANAIKYHQKDKAPIVRITASIVNGSAINDPYAIPDKRYHAIGFADNGIGFEPEYSQRIFELFQRLHGKDEYPGTGLGLSIGKRIVHNHHGSITAIGRPGEGATFTVYLPVGE